MHECNKFDNDLETNENEEEEENSDKEKPQNLSIINREVKDATFITAHIYDKEINVMLDTGSYSNVVTKMFLDQMGIEIDAPVTSKIIDINGQKKIPLGKVKNVKLRINNDEWDVEMIVTESTNYNVILGNQ